MAIVILHWMAAALIAAGLLRAQPLWGSAAMAVIVAVASLMDWGNGRLPRWALAAIALVLQGTLAACWPQGPDDGLLLVAGGVVVALHALALTRFEATVTLSLLPLPALGIGHAWIATDPEAISAGVALAASALAAWPLVGARLAGRHWAWGSAFGMAAVLAVLNHVLILNGSGSRIMGDLLIASWSLEQPHWLVLQAVLLFIGIWPLLINSSERWRWPALIGALAAIGVVLLATATGPWPDGWPWMMWAYLIPALIALAVGGVGMMGGVTRPELLSDAAVRGMAVAVGIAAVALASVNRMPPEPGTLLMSLAPVLAPLQLGLVLAILCIIASQLARRQEKPVLSTTALHRRQHEWMGGIQQSLLSFVSGGFARLREDRASWLPPSALIPLGIFIAAFAAMPIYDERAYVILLPLAVLLSRGFFVHSLVLWTTLQMVLAGIGGWMLVGNLVGALTAAAICAMIALPLARYRMLEPAWAVPASLVNLVLPLSLLEPATDRMNATLLVGGIVLLSNALLGGGGRWLVLPITALFSFEILRRWVMEVDLATIVVLDEYGVGHHLLVALWRLPVLLIVLEALLLNRVERDGLSSGMAPAVRRVFYVLAMVAAVAWLAGWRPQWWMGLPLLVAVGWWHHHQRRVFAVLPPASLRWPVLDSVALLLASVLITMGDGYGRQLSPDGVVAGSMAQFVLTALRDAMACLFAILALVAACRWKSWWWWLQQLWAVAHPQVERLRKGHSHEEVDDTPDGAEKA